MSSEGQVGSVHYSLTLRMEDLERKLSESDRKLDRFLRKEAAKAKHGGMAWANAFAAGLDAAEKVKESELGRTLDSLQSGANRAGNALTVGVTLPMALMAKSAFDATVRMDAVRQTMETIMGSAEAASAEIAKLEKVAKLPGIDFRQSVQLSASLQSIGLSADEARGIMTEFANQIALFGGGQEEFTRMAINLQQVAGMGKLTGDELREMGAIIPSLRGELKRLYGTMDTAEIAKRGLSGLDVIRDLTRQFSAGVRAPVDTLRNDLENLNQDLEMLKAAAGEALVPLAREAMDVVIPAMQDLREALEGLTDEQKRQVVQWVLVAMALGPVTKGFAGVLGLANSLIQMRAGMLATQAAMAATATASGSAATGIASVGV
ncbi:MAG: tape measure protein, partial [Fimbriimonadaceae bacterium]|nr:tape measure protein [Fimbriimonadaceae bacterium]